MSFICERCGDEFTQKKGLIKHLNRKTPCEATEKDISIEDYLQKLEPKKSEKFECCEYCNKELSCKKSLWRHKKTCQVKAEKDKDNAEKIKELTQEVVELTKQLELEKNKKVIQNKQTINNTNNDNRTTNNDNRTTNNITNNTVIYNITVPFGRAPPPEISKKIYESEDYEKNMNRAISDPNINGICKIIEIHHFNGKVPEMQNMRNLDKDSDKMYVFDMKLGWVEKDKSDTIKEACIEAHEAVEVHVIETGAPSRKLTRPTLKTFAENYTHPLGQKISLSNDEPDIKRKRKPEDDIKLNKIIEEVNNHTYEKTQTLNNDVLPIKDV